MKDEKMDDRMEEQSKQREETHGKPNPAFQWAVGAGLMDTAAEACAPVTREELSVVLHRTLEYFWEQVITAVKEG